MSPGRARPGRQGRGGARRPPTPEARAGRLRRRRSHARSPSRAGARARAPSRTGVRAFSATGAGPFGDRGPGFSGNPRLASGPGPHFSRTGAGPLRKPEPRFLLQPGSGLRREASLPEAPETPSSHPGRALRSHRPRPGVRLRSELLRGSGPGFFGYPSRSSFARRPPQSPGNTPSPTPPGHSDRTDLVRSTAQVRAASEARARASPRPGPGLSSTGAEPLRKPEPRHLLQPGPELLREASLPEAP